MLFHGNDALDDRFQNTNPERGRKHKINEIIVRELAYFRTRTPKGDGNFPFLLPLSDGLR